MGDYEPLELRAIETCCQCNAGTACKQHELHLSTVRENWSKCGGSLAGYRRRLPDRCEGLHECARYWQMVVDMNEHQKEHFTHKIISSLFNTVTNKKIAVFGFAFKKDTGDVRETPALKVVEMLLQDGA